MHLQYQNNYSWTDDLPICKDSGIGTSTTQSRKDEDKYQESYPGEDLSYRIKNNDITSLYGIFDGHGGTFVAKLAKDRLIAELLLGQLDRTKTTEEIKNILRTAFAAVEQHYLEAVSKKVIEKKELQMVLSTSRLEAHQNFPKLVEKIGCISAELSGGSTAVVALLHNDKLYVANVGDCRALLGRTDANNVLKVQELTVNHDISNEDECLRLNNLGITDAYIRKGSILASRKLTRCLGNYMVKYNYQELESDITTQAVNADPEIIGGIQIDNTCQFLLLMSSGLYRTLEEATGTKNVNRDLTLLVVEQFRVQTTLCGVAQAVIDKIVSRHRELFASKVASEGFVKIKREDMTLIIRNFNYPLPNAISSSFASSVHSSSSNQIASSTNSFHQSHVTTISPSTDSTSTSIRNRVPVFPLRNERIPAYVDFSGYYKNVEEARKKGTLSDVFNQD